VEFLSQCTPSKVRQQQCLAACMLHGFGFVCCRNQPAACACVAHSALSAATAAIASGRGVRKYLCAAVPCSRAALLLLLLQVGLEVVVLCCAIKPLCAWNAETCATTSRWAAYVLCRCLQLAPGLLVLCLPASTCGLQHLHSACSLACAVWLRFACLHETWEVVQLHILGQMGLGSVR
jgi:hypothetical protein